jgi:hypothetical protein
MAKWIRGAINPAHKGMEQHAAKKAGERTHEYMEGHKDAPGAAGSRARLGLRLEGMHHADGGPVDKAAKLYGKKKVKR